MTVRRLLVFLVLLLSQRYTPAYAQTYCNMTMELSVSTGYNPKTGGKLDPGSPQNLWEVTYVSPAAAALYPGMPALPYPAYIPPVIPWPLIAARSNWISYLPEGSCMATGTEEKDSIWVTYTRRFSTCMRDSFLVSLNIANDDYCSQIRIDGRPVPKASPFSQPDIYNESNFRNWTTVPEFMIRLSSGEHTLSVDVHNLPVAGKSLTGLNIEGKLFTLSARNSLVNAGESPACRCSCAAPIAVHALPADTLVCMGDSVVLRADGADRYLWRNWDGSWEDSSESPRVPVSSLATGYKLQGIDGACSGEDTAWLRGRELPALQLAAATATACMGTAYQLRASGAQFYHWWPEADLDNADKADPLLQVKGAAVYYLKGWDEIGCTRFDTFHLDVFPQTSVAASASENRIDCKQGYVQLRASGAQTYRWEPASYCDDPQSDSPRVTAPGTRLFTVTGTDQYGCRIVDSVLVEYAGSSIVKMPSAFSPNNDLVNDELKPIPICDFTQESLQVFNRWGHQVFNSANIQHGWDGNYKGTPCDGGTYFYVLQGKDSNGATVTVALLR
jgi:gliding motility-associated-like protein